jgi:hypothetical protein
MKAILRLLRAEGIKNVRSIAFTLGVTRRWAIAWTFSKDGIDSLGSEQKVFSKKNKVKRKLNTMSNINTDQEELKPNRAARRKLMKLVEKR